MFPVTIEFITAASEYFMNIDRLPAEDSGPDGLYVRPPSMVAEWGVHRQVLVAYGPRSLYALPRGSRLFISVHSRSAGESFEEVNLAGLVGKTPGYLLQHMAGRHQAMS